MFHDNLVTAEADIAAGSAARRVDENRRPSVGLINLEWNRIIKVFSIAAVCLNVRSSSIRCFGRESASPYGLLLSRYAAKDSAAEHALGFGPMSRP
jgi:hypothetical protein